MYCKVNAAIIESYAPYAHKIEGMLKNYFAARQIQLDCRIYSKGSDLLFDDAGYQIAIIDVNAPNTDIAKLNKSLRLKNRQTDIVLIANGPETDRASIDTAVNGYRLGVRGVILKTFDDAKIINVFSFALGRTNVKGA